MVRVFFGPSFSGPGFPGEGDAQDLRDKPASLARDAALPKRELASKARS
jgi:hypothetical protein